MTANKYFIQISFALLFLVVLGGVLLFFNFPPTVYAANVTSIQSGNWSDSTTWSTGVVPVAGDAVTISAGKIVVYDVVDSQISGMTIEAGAKLAFDPQKTTVLKTDKNILVLGELEVLVVLILREHQKLRGQDYKVER